MISDSETKGSDPQRGGSHCFPLLNDTLVDPAGSSGDSVGTFKPLFNSSTIDEKMSACSGIGVSCPDEDQNTEDTVRQKGYERGFDAGKQDACSLVQEEAAPQIKSFSEAFSLWNANMMRAEEEACLHILKMSAAIAEKILGAPPQCCTDKLESVKADLSARMRKAYQLELKLNPKDMDTLSGMIGCGNVHWEHWEYITATRDTDVQTGSLSVASDTQGLSVDDGILRALDASLSQGPEHVSTK